jgi:hypothetical protein
MHALSSGPVTREKPEALSAPDPQVVEKARRRQFTAAYKLGILRQAEVCTEPGELGALLSREGLYSSHLTKWRRQREAGVLAGLTPKKRGRKTRPVDPLATRVAELPSRRRLPSTSIGRSPSAATSRGSSAATTSWRASGGGSRPALLSCARPVGGFQRSPPANGRSTSCSSGRSSPGWPPSGRRVAAILAAELR